MTVLDSRRVARRPSLRPLWLSGALAALGLAFAQLAFAQQTLAQPAFAQPAEPSEETTAVAPPGQEPVAEAEPSVDEVPREIEQTEHGEAPEPARGRPLVDRYLEALAMSWAATGIVVGATGALGMAFGTGVGCAVQSEIGCGAGLIGGGALFAALGWTLGPGIGTASVTGLNGMEGLAIWALGLTSNVAVFGVFALVGTAVDETGQTWGLGRLWGMILGMTLGALAQVFLTPLYAVTIFAERRPTEPPRVSIAPFLAPTEHGVTGGIAGAF